MLMKVKDKAPQSRAVKSWTFDIRFGISTQSGHLISEMKIESITAKRCYSFEKPPREMTLFATNHYDSPNSITALSASA